jgi:hypothetical protein
MITRREPTTTERPTLPPSEADADANAFADAVRRLGEWPARLENLGRLREYERRRSA